MKIFLTGATGFIGSHFINQAQTAGHDIIALKRSSYSMCRIPITKEPSWIISEIENVKKQDLEGCEVIVHLAAHSTNVPYDNYKECIYHNVLAPTILFQKAIELGIKKYVVAGSCFEYGESANKYDFIPTDAPLLPTSSYAASKAAASAIFNALAIQFDLKLILYRIFQVYGDGESENRFWPTLRRKALSGNDMSMSEGLQIRDFVNVTEVASILVSALTRDDILEGIPKFENLGSGNPQSLAKFAQEQWASFHATGKLKFGDIPMRSEEYLRYVPKM
jgi:nucleoside-diphosphate-sugar epimerase